MHLKCNFSDDSNKNNNGNNKDKFYIGQTGGYLKNRHT